MSETRKLAVFIDFENLALGFKVKSGRRRNVKRVPGTFDIGRVLARLVEKGKIIVKVAYATGVRSPTTSRRCTRQVSS